MLSDFEESVGEFKAFQLYGEHISAILLPRSPRRMSHDVKIGDRIGIRRLREASNPPHMFKRSQSKDSSWQPEPRNESLAEQGGEKSDTN